jgi:S-adenosylmethionine:tRNA ribosyltransferase-isomerase
MLSSSLDRLRLSDFDYDLPESLIAQEPAARRDGSRLMVLHRAEQSLEHRMFSDIVDCLQRGDLLVMNDTRVVPCRIPARKPGNGSAEIFLLSERSPNEWNALVKGRVSPGKRLVISEAIEAIVDELHEDGTRTVRFVGVENIKDVLHQVGKLPLPPYIRRQPTADDLERYQTVYAKQDGAVAAPTAGLHFTPELIARLASKGVETAQVTLHVGPGTFQPVRAEYIADHAMLPERYVVSEEAAERINRAKSSGRRIIAVGTTCVRTLESAGRSGVVAHGAGSTNIFIYPGYEFKIVQGLVTNFHLPKSTLLMLVSAFGGCSFVNNAYRTAVAERYRFYSYGDAMLLL